MKHEVAIVRGLRRRNPMHFPRDPAPRNEPEAFLLGCDARNDERPIDENPYDDPYGAEHRSWDLGWAETDRAREADEQEGD